MLRRTRDKYQALQLRCMICDKMYMDHLPWELLKCNDESDGQVFRELNY